MIQNQRGFSTGMSFYGVDQALTHGSSFDKVLVALFVAMFIGVLVFILIDANKRS